MMENEFVGNQNQGNTDFVQGSFMEQARDSMINMNVDELANLQGEMMGEV